MGCNRVVVEHGLRRVHQLLAILDVARIARHRVHEPEFGERQSDRSVPPQDPHPVRVDLELAAPDPVLLRLRLLERIEAPEQCGDPRHQVRQADVFRQVIVRAEPQAAHGIELAVTRGQENDRQFRRT